MLTTFLIIADKLYAKRIASRAFTPLNGQLYWQLFFQQVLTPEEYYYAFADYQDMQAYIAKLEEHPDYISSNRTALFEAERFGQPGKRQTIVLDAAEQFFRLKIRFYEPEFLNRLLFAPEQTLTGIIYDDTALWNCVRVLSAGGILIISAQQAADMTARMTSRPEIKTYRGWIEYLRKQSADNNREDTDKQPAVVTSDMRRLDFYLRFFRSHLKQNISGSLFPEMPGQREFQSANEAKNAETETQILLMTGRPIKEDLLRYVCNYISPDLYDSIRSESPRTFENLSLQFGKGFREMVPDVHNRKFLTLVRAFYLLTQATPADSGANIRISGHEDAYRLIAGELRDEKREVCMLIAMNTKNHPIHITKLAVGVSNSVHIDPKAVFGPAIQLNASAVIVVHNHPSGDPTPSEQDRQITENLRKLAVMLNIRLLDHIIAGNNSYYSFTDRKTFDVRNPEQS
ncbi:hypothetical protein CHS0354_006897 [Potamilus streckersoni]|uniref:MPN domain-containing protein n=1 Tax=Potamilus streckersoni TaxID=2493646 RepID=A0AAE0TEF1_9BIVA|nr:hypothetical protein CHS0354_006897 [Potamilus streckersoni]